METPLNLSTSSSDLSISTSSATPPPAKGLNPQGRTVTDVSNENPPPAIVDIDKLSFSSTPELIQQLIQLKPKKVEGLKEHSLTHQKLASVYTELTNANVPLEEVDFTGTVFESTEAFQQCFTRLTQVKSFKAYNILKLNGSPYCRRPIDALDMGEALLSLSKKDNQLTHYKGPKSILSRKKTSSLA